MENQRLAELVESKAMQKQKIQIPSGRMGWVMLWLCVAGVALGWITGNDGVPVTIWWIILAIACCGVAASLLGFGRFYIFLCSILFSIAMLTMKYWAWILIPSH